MIKKAFWAILAILLGIAAVGLAYLWFFQDQDDISNPTPSPIQTQIFPPPSPFPTATIYP